MRTIALGLLVIAAGIGLASGSAQADSGKTDNKDQPQKHTVAQGESLSSIAADNNLPSWILLWDVNPNLQNPDQINPGDQLIMPSQPYPTTDRPLPPGYDAPAVQTSAVSQVSYQPAVHTAVAGGDLFARIRLRESGGNYAENTGNGYYGAYQYNDSTWGGYGGYAHASDAPPAVQDQKAAQTYAARGCSPWPNTCY